MPLEVRIANHASKLYFFVGWELAFHAPEQLLTVLEESIGLWLLWRVSSESACHPFVQGRESQGRLSQNSEISHPNGGKKQRRIRRE